MSCRRSILVAALLFSSALTACGDPGGPGASGIISLGDGFTPGMAKTLIVRAVPDKGTFDITKPVFDVPPPANETAWDVFSAPTEGLKFPVTYNVGKTLGTTEQEKWRVFAWLSASTETTAVGPSTGELFGTATFSVVSCEQYGGFCQTTERVDMLMEKMAP